MKQVDKDHYTFSGYAYPGRFVSYYHQLQEVLNWNPKTILEVGVGDRVFANYIKNNSSVMYTSFDIAEDLNPDFVGNVTEMPFKDGDFDVVCAFEVLKHIPFELFENAIQELVRVANKAVVISLPHFGPSFEFSLKIPFFKRLKWSFKFPYHPKHVWNGEHYFEIGKKDYEVKKILSILKKYAIVTKHFVPFENQYHHFFILAKDNTLL